MSKATPADANEARRQKYREFLDLMPLTLALAGLPPSEAGKYYTGEQIDARGISIKNAYKTARRVVKEIIES